MRKFLVCLCCLTALFFIISCGGGSSAKDDKTSEEPKPDTDTVEPVNDSDETQDDNNSETQDQDADEENKEDLCNPNPCKDMKNSTGECSVSERGGYVCGCNEGYEWNLTSCEKIFPECGKESETPCKDSSSNLMWSSISQKEMNWNKAVEYCENLDEGGLTDWELPTLTMLRTLISECENTVVGGKCEVSDLCRFESGCFTNPDNCTCPFESNGKYSKLGDSVILWSANHLTDNDKKAWILLFSNAQINIGDKENNGNFVRCVRAPKQTVDCTALPEGAAWDGNLETDQTWNGSEWYPFAEGFYYETSESDKDLLKNECNFICKEGYDWNKHTEKCVSLIDPETGLTWSKLAENHWVSAVSECEKMNKDGETGWHLPTIGELRTLIQNCEGTVPSGICEISDTCLGFDRCDGHACHECEEKDDGSYNRFGDTEQLWSSSENESDTETAWTVPFASASIEAESKGMYKKYRCVKPLTECSPTSSTPCVDSSSGLIWSAKASNEMIWQDAVDYCSSYSEGTLSGWHLPTISELRTLIQNCEGTVTGGTCGVTDSCLSYSECSNTECSSCYSDSSDGRSKLGDSDWFWSSSVDSDVSGSVWAVHFYYGDVSNAGAIENTMYVRCVSGIVSNVSPAR